MNSDINAKPINKKKNKKARRPRAEWNKGHHDGKAHTARNLSTKVDPPSVRKEEKDRKRKEKKLEKEKGDIECDQ